MATQVIEDFKRRYKEYSIPSPTHAQQYSEFHSVINRGKGTLESGQYFNIGLLDAGSGAFSSAAKVLLSEIDQHIFLKRTVEDEPESQPFSLKAVSFGDTDFNIEVERNDKTGLHFLPSFVALKDVDVRLNGIPVIKGKRYRLAAYDCISFHRTSGRFGANNREEVPAILYKPGFNEIDLEDTQRPYNFIKPKEGDDTIDFARINFKIGFGQTGFLNIHKLTYSR
jgi:hypothetical protein